MKVTGYPALKMATRPSQLSKQSLDFLICDISLEGHFQPGGFESRKKINPQTVVIMIPAFTPTETTIKPMNKGTFDFVPEPFNNLELKQIANALTLRTI